MRARLAAAWAPFAADLVAADPAVSAGSARTCQPDCDFATDTERDKGGLTMTAFPDQAQACAAGSVIKAQAQPMARLHRKVCAMVHDAVFTFGDD